ncbi:MAG TPA: hypothetical protein PLS24_06765 [Sedimentisphaerales bacterium]|nr:hypothetical protein [Sedimentisphaerales bacterium]HOV77711.1 hypothetical protein [Sedimentisphaerales bacterium]
MTTRQQFSGPEKMQILWLHLWKYKPISEVCQQCYGKVNEPNA